MFTALPFGLSSACHLFTKLTRPLVYFWRSQGIISFMYIDDGLIISPDHASAQSSKIIVRNTIINSGFVPSKTKCIWEPTEEIQYLGLIIDSRNLLFHIPQEKLFKFLSTISAILSAHQANNSVPVKQLACFTGQVISMSLALGPIARLMTRDSYRSIESSNSWNQSIKLRNDTVAELEFWAQNIFSLNGFSIRLKLVPSMTIYSDASEVGYGGHVENQSNLKIQGNWSQSEKRKSSTWRELAAVLNLLLELQHVVSHKTIKWCTDNSNVPKIITCGSVKPDLHNIALSIHALSKKHDFILLPEWLPRNENKLADKISKFQDFDDWAIDSASFNLIDNLWGPHSIDRFASPHNAKLPRFNARFWCKAVCGVDAFCQSWTSENNYFCLPVSLIIQVIKRIFAVKAKGTLVIPNWTTSAFWPFVCPDGIHLDYSIVDWKVLHTSFSPSSLGKSTVFRKYPNFSCLALRYDFAQSFRSSNTGFCLAPLGSCPDCAVNA